MILNVYKPNLHFSMENERLYSFNYKGRTYYISKGLYNRVVHLKSYRIQLLVTDDNDVLAVYSSRYNYIDNEQLDSIVESAVPNEWLLDAKVVNSLVYYSRFVVPYYSDEKDKQVVFVVVNVNDGSTALRAYYGAFILECSNGLLSEEIALAVRRIHTDSPLGIKREIENAVDKYKEYSTKVLKYAEESGRSSVPSELAEAFFSFLAWKKVLTKREARVLLMRLKKEDRTHYSRFEIANVLTNVHIYFPEIERKPLRWLKVERIAGKVVANPRYIEYAVKRGVM